MTISKLFINFSGADKYQGDVYVAGKPACDQDWDKLDAQVVCTQQGFKKDVTKAIAWRGNSGLLRTAKCDILRNLNEIDILLNFVIYQI